MNRKILGGLAATIAALSIAAPAHAQEVIPPAKPSAPSGQGPTRAKPTLPFISPAQPAAPNVTIGFGRSAASPAAATATRTPSAPSRPPTCRRARP